MKQFLSRTLIFTISLLVILFFCQFITDIGLKQEYSGFFYTWNVMFSNKAHADIVIMGSSRAKKHFVPSVIERNTGHSAINLGVDGTNLSLQQSIWKVYKKNNQLPHILILELDEERLSFEDKIFNKEQYLPYLYDLDLLSGITKVNGFSYLDLLLPFYKYHGYPNIVKMGFRNIFCNNTDSSMVFSKGYQPLQGNIKDIEFKKALLTIDTSQEKLSLNIIQKINNYLSDNHSKLLIIKSPKYKQGRCSITNSEVVNKIFNDFISKEQILYLDFSDLFSAKQTAFFYDQDHLNNAGATVFSDTFSKKLMNLSLLQ